MQNQRKAALKPLAGASASVTVYDRVSFTANVSPEQAAAYVRAKLPGWEEHPRVINYIMLFDSPKDDVRVAVPTRADFADYARRMVELVDALVALGCAQQPSQALAAMAAIGKEPELYLIKTDQFVGNEVLWWRANSAGYTTRFDEAGRYSEADARRIEGIRGTDKAVPVVLVARVVSRTVRAEDLAKALLAT